MAIKALILRKKIDDKKKALDELRAKSVDFEKREEELTQAVEEAETDEEKATVEQEAEKFDAEKKEHEETVSNLESEIDGLEKDLAEEEERAETNPDVPEIKVENRSVNRMDKIKFFGMDAQERTVFFENDGVKGFLSEVRTAIKEKRAINNVGLTIPDVMLPLIREKIERTSKLISRVSLRPVSGKARALIMGTIPEAVWTEMCATLNELSLGFNNIEVDGYKVGGYFAICNAVLEDNDVNLASEIINALGVAIAKALDKAIVYGTGTKMPLGIVTRLAQTTAPADYPATAREWADLHTSNINKGSAAKVPTDNTLFQAMIGYAGAIINDYSSGDITWLMNKKTHMALMTAAVGTNSAGAIVAGIGAQMPIIGGDIVELNFIPDNNIVYGYMDQYLLAERAGIQISQSEHARFIEDQTVFKGTARYDGTPAIPEAFGVVSLTSTAPVTSVTFAPDTANTPAQSGTQGD